MNDFSPLQIAYRQISNTKPEHVPVIFIGAYRELLNSCEYERSDIVETLERGARQAGLSAKQIKNIWERVDDEAIVVPLAELLNPILI